MNIKQMSERWCIVSGVQSALAPDKKPAPIGPMLDDYGECPEFAMLAADQTLRMVKALRQVEPDPDKALKALEAFALEMGIEAHKRASGHR